MRIAIPKGRLQDKTLELFAAAGYDIPRNGDLASRKLVFQRGGIEWIFVKDGDVPVYVEYGAADAGVAGLDQLLEHDSTAYQPVQLPFGACRMMLISGPPIGPRPSALGPRGTVASVATKYPRVASQYLERVGLRADVITLSGSVELSAVLGLTTHVIDLVESGETVRIHNLELQDVVAEIAPRLIVGRNAYRTATADVRELIARIAAAVEEVRA